MSFTIFEDENGVKHRVHISTLHFGNPKDCNGNSTIKETTMNQDQPDGKITHTKWCPRCKDQTTHDVWEISSPTPGTRSYATKCRACDLKPLLSTEFKNEEVLIQAVREMRDLQIQFFKDTRNMDVLSRAKAAEKRVDALLAEMDSPQGRLM